ncbi:MAG: glycosyltransferase [Chloroherpetonaceae bacterium]|nr:glycosyltransferase [Chloroherpetonaceae bacterium]
MAQLRFSFQDPKPFDVDICFVFFGDIRFDSRLQNIVRSFTKNSFRVRVVQAGDEDGAWRYEQAEIISVKVPTERRGVAKFGSFYFSILPKVSSILAKIYCAEDVFSLPVAAHAAKKHRGELFYDSREIYSAIGALLGKKVRQKIWSTIEKRYIHKASVFCTGDLDADLLATSLSIEKPEVIYNYPNLQPIKRTNLLRQKLFLEDSATLLIYQGMISDGRGLEIMIRAMQSLPSTYYFVLFGDGNLKSSLQQLVESLSLSERVFFAGKVPYEELLDHTASADIGISLIEPISKSYELALPNKLFEYTLAGIPSLVSNLPALKDTVEKYKIGKVAEHDSPTSIIESILHLNKEKEYYRANCQRASRVLNWQAQEVRLIDFFKSKLPQ